MVGSDPAGGKTCCPIFVFSRRSPAQTYSSTETWKTTQVMWRRGKKGTQTGKAAQKRGRKEGRGALRLIHLSVPSSTQSEGGRRLTKSSLFSSCKSSPVCRLLFPPAMAVEEEKLQQPSRALEERSPSRKCQQTAFGRPKKRTSSSSISADLISMTAKR